MIFLYEYDPKRLTFGRREVNKYIKGERAKQKKKESKKENAIIICSMIL